MAGLPTEKGLEAATGYLLATNTQPDEARDVYASKSPYDIILNPTQLKRQRAGKSHASIGTAAQGNNCAATSRSPYLASAHAPERLKESEQGIGTKQPGRIEATPS